MSSRARLSLLTCLPLLACAPERSAAPSDAAHSEAGHADALDWAEFGPEVFERAAAEDRIVLINVVATWCHWCHVMEAKTYANPEVAALLDAHFVVIRVDSDARPDVSERYGAWGWPATAVLSPQAEPILNLRGYQEAGEFAGLLRELIAERDAGELQPRTELLARGQAKTRAAGSEDLEALRAEAAGIVDRYYDPEAHGWGARQKYPWWGVLDFALMRAHVRGGDELQWRGAALATLEAQRPLVDPEWGGVYQYSLHGVWDQPHFEKIAAVQGGALENYAHALMLDEAALDGKARARLADDAGLVLRYLEERMGDPAGGFYTSQDADAPELVGKEFYALSARQRRKYAPPKVDTAIYADLNGRIIHGLTELYRADPARFGRALGLAMAAGERLLETYRRADGSFSHGALAGGDSGMVYLADQAAMGWALLGLFRCTADPRWLEAARGVAQAMQAQLVDEAGGFYAHTADPDAVGVFNERRKPVVENAMAARFLIELHRIEDHDASLGDAPQPPWLELARQALIAVGSPDQLKSAGKGLGGYLMAVELLAATPVDITVVGAPGDAKADALWMAALRIYEPRGSLERSLPGERYPDTGSAAVFLCTDQSCSSPLREPEALAEKAARFFADQL